MKKIKYILWDIPDIKPSNYIDKTYSIEKSNHIWLLITGELRHIIVFEIICSVEAILCRTYG